jgi:phospholipid/cholesterol/gamma-HCH transport system permease protein
VVLAFVDAIGYMTLSMCDKVGRFVVFLVKALQTLFTTKLKYHKTFVQMRRIGVDSLTIAVLTGTFTGMVLALQSYIGFQRVGGEQFIGSIVALGMVRELGPVLTALMVTGRAGSAITAELGTMNITEQIDALKTLRINPFQYLVIPRIIGGTLILPFLTIFAMMCGILGGYMICVHVLGLSPEDFTNSIKTYLELTDIRDGLIKALCFGFILTWVGTYMGSKASGGARGVGQSTTQSVVTSSIMILVSNYFLTKLLAQL